MDDLDSKRVRAAAGAAWWTLLIAILFGVFITVMFMAFLHHKPVWVIRMWGPDMTWAIAQVYALAAITAYRVFVWIWLIVTIWLTIWARKLRKAGA